ncbi:MAG: hypothetical protein K2X41_12680 [Hyphomicrobium sp.]|nr:hypothetical protein [Hyphomicrobium sp.]
MVWITLIVVALLSGSVFGLLAAIVRTKGRRAALGSGATLFVGCCIGGAFAYSAYLDTRHGSLPPEHFYNSVLGNVVVVGGLVFSVSGILGIAAAFVAFRRVREP